MWHGTFYKKTQIAPRHRPPATDPVKPPGNKDLIVESITTEIDLIGNTTISWKTNVDCNIDFTYSSGSISKSPDKVNSYVGNNYSYRIASTIFNGRTQEIQYIIKLSKEGYNDYEISSKTGFFQGPDKNECKGMPVTVGQAGVIGSYSYQWTNEDDNDITGMESSSTSATPTFTLQEPQVLKIKRSHTGKNIIDYALVEVTAQDDCDFILLIKDATPPPGSGPRIAHEGEVLEVVKDRFDIGVNAVAVIDDGSNKEEDKPSWTLDSNELDLDGNEEIGINTDLSLDVHEATANALGIDKTGKFKVFEKDERPVSEEDLNLGEPTNTIEEIGEAFKECNKMAKKINEGLEKTKITKFKIPTINFEILVISKVNSFWAEQYGTIHVVRDERGTIYIGINSEIDIPIPEHIPISFALKPIGGSIIFEYDKLLRDPNAKKAIVPPDHLTGGEFILGIEICIKPTKLIDDSYLKTELCANGTGHLEFSTTNSCSLGYTLWISEIKGTGKVEYLGQGLFDQEFDIVPESSVIIPFTCIIEK